MIQESILYLRRLGVLNIWDGIVGIGVERTISRSLAFDNILALFALSSPLSLVNFMIIVADSMLLTD